jgi:hypothetical protein
MLRSNASVTLPSLAALPTRRGCCGMHTTCGKRQTKGKVEWRETHLNRNSKLRVRGLVATNGARTGRPVGPDRERNNRGSGRKCSVTDRPLSEIMRHERRTSMQRRVRTRRSSGLREYLACTVLGNRSNNTLCTLHGWKRQVVLEMKSSSGKGKKRKRDRDRNRKTLGSIKRPALA